MFEFPSKTCRHPQANTHRSLVVFFFIFHICTTLNTWVSLRMGICPSQILAVACHCLFCPTEQLWNKQLRFWITYPFHI